MVDKRSCVPPLRARGPVQPSKRVQPSLLSSLQPLKAEPHSKTPGALKVGGKLEKWGFTGEDSSLAVGSESGKGVLQHVEEKGTGRFDGGNGLVGVGRSNGGECLGQDCLYGVTSDTERGKAAQDCARVLQKKDSILIETDFGGKPVDLNTKARGLAAVEMDRRVSSNIELALEIGRQVEKGFAEPGSGCANVVNGIGLTTVESTRLARPMVKGVDYVADSEDEEDEAPVRSLRFPPGRRETASPFATANPRFTGSPLNPPSKVNPNHSSFERQQPGLLTVDIPRDSNRSREAASTPNATILTPPHAFPGFQTPPIASPSVDLNPLFKTPSIASGPNPHARVSTNQPVNSVTPLVAPASRTSIGAFVTPTPSSGFRTESVSDVSEMAGPRFSDVTKKPAQFEARRRSTSDQPAVSVNPGTTPVFNPPEVASDANRSTSKPPTTIPGLTLSPPVLSSKPPRLAHARVRQEETGSAVGTRLRAIRKRSREDDLDPPSFSLGIGEASELPTFDLGLGSDDEREGQRRLQRRVREAGLAGTSRGSEAAGGGLGDGAVAGLEGGLEALQNPASIGKEGLSGMLRGSKAAKQGSEGCLEGSFEVGLKAGLGRHNRVDAGSPVAGLAEGSERTERGNRTTEPRKSSKAPKRSESASPAENPSRSFEQRASDGAAFATKSPTTFSPNDASSDALNRPPNGSTRVSAGLAGGLADSFADSDEEDRALLSIDFRSASKSRTSRCPFQGREPGWDSGQRADGDRSKSGTSSRPSRGKEPGLKSGQRMEVDLTGEAVGEAVELRTSAGATHTDALKGRVSDGLQPVLERVSEGRKPGLGRILEGFEPGSERVFDGIQSGFGRVSDGMQSVVGRVSNGFEASSGRVSDAFRTPPVSAPKWKRLQKSVGTGERKSHGAETPSGKGSDLGVREMELERREEEAPLIGSAPVDDEIEDFSSPEKATPVSVSRSKSGAAPAFPRQPQGTNGSLPRGPAFSRPAPVTETPKTRRGISKDPKTPGMKIPTNERRSVEGPGGPLAVSPKLRKRSVEVPGVPDTGKGRPMSFTGPTSAKWSVEGPGILPAAQLGLRNQSVDGSGVSNWDNSRPSASARKGRKLDGNGKAPSGDGSPGLAPGLRGGLSPSTDGLGGKKRSAESPGWVEREAKKGKRWAGFGGMTETATKSEGGSLKCFGTAGFGGFGTASERTYPHFGPASTGEDDKGFGGEASSDFGDANVEGFGGLGERTAGRAWSPPPPDFTSLDEEERNWRSGRAPTPAEPGQMERGAAERNGTDPLERGETGGLGRVGSGWEERTESDWLRTDGTRMDGTEEGRTRADGMGEMGRQGKTARRSKGDRNGIDGTGRNGTDRDGFGPRQTAVGLDGTGMGLGESRTYGMGLDDNGTDGLERNGTGAAGTGTVGTEAEMLRLLRERLPHYKPLDILMREGGFDNEPIFIDYRNQFADVPSGGATGRSSAGTTSTGRKRAGAKASGSIHTGGAAEKGHWTTLDGKKVYVNKTGKMLEGRAAYRSHLKDSGAQPKRARKKSRKKGSGRKG